MIPERMGETMFTMIGTDYTRQRIENAERIAGREGRQRRAAKERCVRSGLLRLCRAPAREGRR
ncbi:MAG: hypothetical protein WC709_08715 [Thermoleophilia bacterium]